jgi:hypothetical protein
MSGKCFHFRIIYFFLGHIVFLSVRVFGFSGKILLQEDIVIQNVYKKLSFAFNDSEEKLETMTEALNEAYQQQNDRINQLQKKFSLQNYIFLFGPYCLPLSQSIWVLWENTSIDCYDC